MIKYTKLSTAKLRDMWAEHSCKQNNPIFLSILLDMFKVAYSCGKCESSAKGSWKSFIKILISSTSVCMLYFFVALIKVFTFSGGERKLKKIKKNSRIIIVSNEVTNKTNHLLKLRKKDDFLISLGNVYEKICKHNADIGAKNIRASDIFFGIFEFFCFIMKIGVWNNEVRLFSQKLTLLELARCYVKAIRGLCYFNVLKREVILNRKHVFFFSHSGMSDTNILELYIQSSFQCKTCHVLHGVSPGFDFYSFSSLFLCNNPVDSSFFSKISRGHCFINHIFHYKMPALIKLNSLANKSVLIATNIIHPSNSSSLSNLVKLETYLLLIVHNILKKSQCIIYWRPHPRIKDFDDSVLHTMKFKCKELGFVFDERSLDKSIGSSSLVISNESTVIVDSILSQTPFAMFTSDSPDESTLYGKLANSHQFMDEESLMKVISLYGYKDEN